MKASIVLLSAVISLSDLRKEFPIVAHDTAIVQDAMTRWIAKDRSSEIKAMDNRATIVFYFARKRCVTFRLRVGSVGGDPIYCYGRESDRFIDAYDDLE